MCSPVGLLLKLSHEITIYYYNYLLQLNKILGNGRCRINYTLYYPFLLYVNYIDLTAYRFHYQRYSKYLDDFS